MDDNRINKQAKCLTIGDFNIIFNKTGTDIKMEIPLAGMAFYDPDLKHADFCFQIATQDNDESGQLLWGSEDFSIPTFLYQRDNGFFDWITKQNDRSPGMKFRISKDWANFVLYQDHTESKGDRAFREFASLFSYAILNHNACVFHGVVMEYEGKGILVMASAGTGKTTHTRMWRNYKMH